MLPPPKLPPTKISLISIISLKKTLEQHYPNYTYLHLLMKKPSRKLSSLLKLENKHLKFASALYKDFRPAEDNF